MCSGDVVIVLIFATFLVAVNGMPFLQNKAIKNSNTVIPKDDSSYYLIFPEDDYNDNSIEIDLKIDGTPKCADGSSFCENFNPYPVEKIQSVLEESSQYNDFWGRDEEGQEIVGRDGEDEKFICKAMKRTIFPNLGKNKSNKWKYIVNQPNGLFKQGITIEFCRTPGGACDTLSQMPTNYITYCKQKYLYRRLISLNEDGSPAVDTFKIPSACCCAYKKKYDFLSRFKT